WAEIGLPAGVKPVCANAVKVYQAPLDGVQGTLDFPTTPQGYGDGRNPWYSWMKVHTFATTNYALNNQVFGNPCNDSNRWDGCNLNRSTQHSLAIQQIRNGTTNTVLFAEKRASCPLSWMPGGRTIVSWVSFPYEWPNAPIFHGGNG